MQVNGYDTKTLHDGDYKVVVQDGLIVVQMGDHAIVLSDSEARTLAFSLGLEVSRKAQGKGW
jgi:hypothetical protein